MAVLLLIGMGIGYSDLSAWSAAAGLSQQQVLLVMACSFFVQAAEGATFALVPLVKPRITGQIAGNVGAYGNVGAVAYLTILCYCSKKLLYSRRVIGTRSQR